jgi:hypothetical protein
MSQSKTFLWHKCFKDVQMSVDNNEHSGRPSTSTTPENITKVGEASLVDHRWTIHDVCEIVGQGCSRHFGRQFEHEMHFCEICAKTAEWRSEGPSCFCLQKVWTTSRRPLLHLQYHNRWWNRCMVMSLRVSSSCHSGSH